MCDSGGDRPGTALARLVGAVASVREAAIPEKPAAMRDEMLELRRVIGRLEVHFSLIASAFAGTDEREWQGHVSPIQWLRVQCGMTAGAAWQAICVGEQAPAVPVSVAAVEAGPLGFAHLAALAGTARVVRDSPTALAFDEQPLLKQALTHDLKRFRDDCAHVRHAHDAAAFQAEQTQNANYRRLEVRTEESGALYAHGWFDAIGGATIRSALDPMARRTGADDTRSRDRRYADALVELATHSLAAGARAKGGGHGAQVHVTTTLETLRGIDGAPAGVLEGAGPVAAATVQRLACDANITRVVLGPDSAVLDVGRSRRVPSVSTRRALRARDRGCVWPGCDRVGGWTAAHHLLHWAQGGATELDNLVLICHRHHRMVHEGGWTLARSDDGSIVSVAPVPDVTGRARPPDIPAG